MRSTTWLAVLLLFSGCTTTREYEVTEAALRDAVPTAVKQTMHVGGSFNETSDVYVANINMLAYAYMAIRVTLAPSPKPDRFRVTADVYGYSALTGNLIKFDDADTEREFHRRLQALFTADPPVGG